MRVCYLWRSTIIRMILLRLSGHSGAGKTRLVNALPKYGVSIPRVVRYTSRPAREGEVHGEDYFFVSGEFIESLPEQDFLVGPVRNLVQAFDLRKLENDLRAYNLVLIEIYPDLWPGLLARMTDRLGKELKTASVFMTAVDPKQVKKFPDDTARSEYITREVEKILASRKKDAVEDMEDEDKEEAEDRAEAREEDEDETTDEVQRDEE